MADVNKSVGDGEGGRKPELSKTELEANVSEKNSALAGEVIAILPS